MFNGEGFAIETEKNAALIFNLWQAANRIIPSDHRQEEAGGQRTGSVKYDGSIVISLREA
jgi:hypothetical protein